MTRIVLSPVNNSSSTPPRFVEYAYYALVCYAIMGTAWGLQVASLGAGMAGVLAVYCVSHLGSRMMTVYAPLVLPLGCGISFIVVQLLLHEESLADVREFVLWMLVLMIVQSLALRPGFLHRFAFVAFVIGLTALPHLGAMSGQGGLVRMHLERTNAISNLANANGLAAWFGFCCVYFTIVGFETKRMAVRVAAWLVAAGCLYVVGLTVSRGPLLAIAIAIIVALRRLLKRSFLPVIVLISLGWIIYELEIFNAIATSYGARGTEDTGRLSVWPLVIERFLSSPLIGIGVSDIGTYVPGKSRLITPHNSFLYLALASGVIPLIFFLGYWIRTARQIFGRNIEQVPDAPFRISLFVYAFMIALQLNTSFMFPWMVVTLCVVSSAPRRLFWVRKRDISENREYPIPLTVVPFHRAGTSKTLAERVSD